MPPHERPVASYHITSPDETKHLANDLARFIRENKLFHNIQGKEYVNVEGWQYAGSRLGILPIVEELDRIGGLDEAEIKYQAKVKLFDLQTSQVVGTGFAICSNKESSKKFYQEFAIASMAQTRAIGKAYRNILAWIIRAAGYEPTPAEEMEYLPTAQPPVRPLHEASPKARPEAKPTEEKPEAPLPAAASASEALGLPAELSQAKVVEPVFKPVTINQKTQILLLLNNSVITKEEKERMVTKLNTLDTERAEQAITKLKKVIRERGNTSGMAA
ncbi:MAG: hypothetical protein H7Z75_07810 [Ferruginibacter sp.]|nr:hypothetical protein [Cytophagales bacterium]